MGMWDRPKGPLSERISKRKSKTHKLRIEDTRRKTKVVQTRTEKECTIRGMEGDASGCVREEEARSASSKRK